MRREETAAVPPEQWPDLLAIGLRQRQALQRTDGEKFKAPFIVWRREFQQFLSYLEQKHQPMRLIFITVFADDAGQMQIRE